MEEVEAPATPAVEEVAALAPLKEILVLVLIEEAKAPLMEETSTLLIEARVLAPFS